MARILVIEDEPDIRQVLDYNLRMAGHDVLAASQGQDGLKLVHAQHHHKCNRNGSLYGCDIHQLPEPILPRGIAVTG